MYIYKITVLVKWSYDESDKDVLVNEAVTYNVAAKNFSQALAKVEKLACHPSKKFKDTQDGVEVTHYPEYVVDVVSVERGEELDG